MHRAVISCNTEAFRGHCSKSQCENKVQAVHTHKTHINSKVKGINGDDCVRIDKKGLLVVTNLSSICTSFTPREERIYILSRRRLPSTRLLAHYTKVRAQINGALKRRYSTKNVVGKWYVYKNRAKQSRPTNAFIIIIIFFFFLFLFIIF